MGFLALGAAAAVGPVTIRWPDGQEQVVRDLAVARSGYSKQGGFEIYVDATSQRALWDALWTAGQDLGLQLEKLADCDRIFQDRI